LLFAHYFLIAEQNMRRVLMMQNITLVTFLSFIFLVMLSASTSAAGVVNQFEVEFVRVDRTGRGYIQFKEALVSQPAECSVGYPKALAFDTRQDGGSAILSVALTAKASNSKIYAKGTGTCSIYGVMEDWEWGYVK
jgi:hypothetical protein